MSDQDSTRAQRYEINKPCILNPWKVPAKLDNMSLTGALIHCLDFPEDLLTSTEAELQIEDLSIPGELIRTDKYKLAMHFSELDSALLEQVKSFLQQFK